MPLPRTLARFNRVVTNVAARPVARLVPPLAIVVHEGRRTGKGYRTPVLAFRTDRGFAIPATYGAETTDWVKNVLTAGECRLERAGEEHRLTAPRLVAGQRAVDLVPAAVRPGLAALDVDEVLHLRISDS